jgi:uncharacterized repeat protein (TIGR01451 family)
MLLCCLLFTPFLSVPSASVEAQGSLVVTDMVSVLTANDLVSSLLGADSGITVLPDSVAYIGAMEAAGTFTGGGAAFGFDAGLILSTGRADGVIGANAETQASTNHGAPGDQALQAIIGMDTRDAAILEFDFVPDGDYVGFVYEFASEEYNEYVGGYNDGFALLVNGVNYAEVTDVGGQAVPVTINNINLNERPQYYRNNVPDDGPYVDAPTSMNGLTVVLTMRAPVNRGQVNRVKLVIADAWDDSYDSNVMIKQYSMTTREADLSLAMTTSCHSCPEGEEVTFDLALRNAGPDAAIGVQVRNLLPEGLDFVSATPSQGTYSHLDGIWDAGSLAVDAQVTLSLVAGVTDTEELTNEAEIILSDQIAPDSTPNNGIRGEDDYARVRINTPNSAPTAIELSEKSVDEGSPTGTLVGYLSTEDPDEDDTHIYALADSADGRFRIDTTRLEVGDGTLLDYETDASHEIIVRSTDSGGLWVERTFTIDLNDVEEPPVLATNIGLTVNEGESGVINSTHLRATDEDSLPSEIVFTLGTAPARGTLAQRHASGLWGCLYPDRYQRVVAFLST